MFEKLLTDLPNRDVFELLSKLTEWIDRGAQGVSARAYLFYAIGILVALGVGLFGYRLIKPWTAVFAAVAGYFLTGNGMMILKEKVATEIPMVLVYVLAIAVGAVLGALAFVKFAYVFYSVMALIGFGVVYFYTQNLLFAIVGALLFGLACMFIMRISFILLTSLIGGAVTVSLLSAMLPDVTVLRLALDNPTALLLALGLSVLMALIQFLSTRSMRASGGLRRARSVRNLFSFN
ncbi:MAG: hypothetical protein IJW30_04745 [Clostridia bacterium]|nr:hypothetical protein [Clostridia bacterium]